MMTTNAEGTVALAPDPTTLKARTREWVALNPLRRWRTKHGLSMMDAASALGVGMSAIQHWETGGHYPNDDSTELLARALAVKSPTLARSWREWYQSRPQV